MPGKGTDYAGKAINAMAGAAAAFIARKAIGFAWTKITGKKPPEAVEDQKVAMGEAVAWAFVLGAGVGVARVLAVRLASRQSGRQLPAASDADV
ncbi:MAG TPA: DUF4235 domain-containing protein [Streptosporangiaceae bacterium]|nr:DUF4235 domain-containing protein [Streptosporangiaceae bacterium]